MTAPIPSPDAADPDLRILGPVELSTGPAELGGPKQQRVLVRLALDAGTVVSVDRLVDAVWGGTPPSKPEVTLRTYVSLLRRALTPLAEQLGCSPSELLATRSPGYVLTLDADRIDIHRFERGATEILAEAREAGDSSVDWRPQAEALLELWRSDDLGGHDDEWVEAERSALAELRTRLQLALYEAALDAGPAGDVIPGLRRLVTDSPLREEPRRLLVLALYRSGRTAEALEEFERARTLLAEELGLDLSPVLAGLDVAILRNDPALSPPTPTTKTHAHRPALFGRQRELDVAARRLEALAAGAGSLVVLTGEPGIGKTTLATALLDTAPVPVQVAWGRCHDGAQDATLWPWARLLRDVLGPLDDHELEALVGAQGPDLADLLPDIGRRLGLERGASRDDRSVTDAVEVVLDRLAARRPLVIVFDDLQWADPATLDLLAFLGPTVVDRPICLVLTWRSTENLADDAADRLHGLGRLAGPGRLDLGGLDRDGLAALFAAIRETEPASDELDLLARQSGGNPLFAHELLRGDTTTPTATVREAIDQRLDTLAGPAVEVLRTTALARRPLRSSTVTLATGLTSEEVDAALGQATAAGILVRTDAGHGLGDGSPEDDVHHFAHVLIADRVVDRMPSAARAAGHAALARALERVGATPESLAYHYRRGAPAGTNAEAAAWTLTTARQSIALHDHPTAERLLERALEFAAAADDLGLQADCCSDLAQVAKFLARYVDAHRWSSRSFELAEAADDVERMCRAALIYAGHVRAETDTYGTQWLGYWNPSGPAIAMLETCLERLDPDDVRHVAVSLSLTSQRFGEFADPERCISDAREALQRARRLGETALVTDGLFNLHTAQQRSLSTEERTEILAELDEVAARAGLPERRLDACRARYVAALDDGDRGEADRQIARAGTLAARSDDYLLAVQHRTMQISDLTMRGHHDEALVLVERSFTEFERIGFTSLEVFGIQYATLQREVGALDTVVALLRERVHGYPGPAYGLPLATCLLEQGDSEAAADLLSRFDPAEILAGGEGVLQFTMLAFASDLAVPLSGDDFVARLHDALLPSRNRIVAMFDGLVLRGSGSLHLGRLATRLGRFDDAETYLTEALAHHHRIGAIPQVLRTELALAELAAARADTTDLGGPHLDAAMTLAGEVNMSWLVDHRKQAAAAPFRNHI